MEAFPFTYDTPTYLDSCLAITTFKFGLRLYVSGSTYRLFLTPNDNFRSLSLQIILQSFGVVLYNTALSGNGDNFCLFSFEFLSMIEKEKSVC